MSSTSLIRIGTICYFLSLVCASSVEEQYESLPYPPISAEHEVQLAKLIMEETESQKGYRISLIDHHLFNGQLQSKVRWREDTTLSYEEGI